MNQKIKEAMKEKNKPKLEALRYLKAMLLENKTAKKPKEEMDVIIAHHKKLRDSISMYPEGSEQASKIIQEASFIEEFLPQQLSEEEVIQLIKEISSSLDKPNMGGIMKELSPKIKGKFDGKKASELVKSSLN